MPGGGGQLYLRTWSGKEQRYIYYHRSLMELILGRKLHRWEIVHHIDGNKLNNIPDNLEVINIRKHTRAHNNRARLSCSKNV